jgi:hypothetical protein
MSMHEDESLFPNLIPLNSRRVYFGLGENGLIKIGVTSRKSGRRGGEMHFTEMGSVPGGRNVENYYHMKYAAERQGKSEWFEASDRLLLDMTVMCAQQGRDWAVEVLKTMLLRRYAARRRDAA